MFLKSGDEYISMATLRRIYPKSGKWKAETDDGRVIELALPFSDKTFELLGTTIIPAHADEIAYRVFVDETSRKASREQLRVIAWAFTPGVSRPTALGIERARSSTK